jgi:hypothetical protein
VLREGRYFTDEKINQNDRTDLFVLSASVVGRTGPVRFIAAFIPV